MNAQELTAAKQTSVRDSSRSAMARQQRRLKGDLDNIVLKALRKEPSRRYASAEQLAEDIRRHLQGLPVAATPDSLSYRANKFVQRHRVGVAASAVLIVAILAGIFATARQARIAEANRRPTDRVAAALLKEGQTKRAAKEYEECRGILEPLAQNNPDTTEVLYALAETYTGEGDVSLRVAKEAKQRDTRSAGWKGAADWYQRNLNMWSRVPNPVRISTSMMEVRTPAEVAQKLAQCKAQQSTNGAQAN